MPNKMLIDATHPEETRVVVVRGNRVEEFDYETANRKQLRGNIYLAKVTRVEPSLQAAFIEYGGNRHGFLAFSEIHPDYYQIPTADRQALLEDEARAHRDEEDEQDRRSSRRRGRHRSARRRDEAVRSEPIAANGDTATESAPTVSTEAAGDTATSEAIDNAAISHGMAASDPSAHPAEDAPAPGDSEAPASNALTNEPVAVATSADTPEAVSIDHHQPDAATAHAAPVELPTVADIGTLPAEATVDTPSESEFPENARERHDAVAESAAGDDENGRHDDDHDENGDDESGNGNGYNGNGYDDDHDDDDEHPVEIVGGADALEEAAPPRPRHRRQYKIQEVIKRRQVMLVQVVKEERGTKGAALTTYLSLAGRYSVLMPNTARGGGISRKITSAEDRRRMKEMVEELQVPEGMGIILRTAGQNRTKTEIKRDFEYLLRVWEQVRDLTLKSTAPTLVYEEGSLTKRSIRDLYNKDIDEIIVAGERGYRDAKDFMHMLMPSHARNVKHYRDTQPIFTRYGIESQLDAMFSPTVQLKSGGYIVINQTEALVAIDVNSGRATREHHIEDTALKTNLEAADEVARQLRLRDLAGLIVIDFIDMDEGRNNRTVERRLKEALKHDRARIQVGRISHFGLLEMSRQRIRTSVLESSTEKCPYCGGSGHIRSVSSVALQLLRALEEQFLKGATHNLIVRTRPDVALYALNHKRAHLRALEDRFEIAIVVNADADFAGQMSYEIVRGDQVHTLEAAKVIAARTEPLPPTIDEEDAALDAEFADAEAEELAKEEAAELHAAETDDDGEARDGDAEDSGDGERGRSRRRRRGRRGRGGRDRSAASSEDGTDQPADYAEGAEPDQAADDAEASEAAAAEGDDNADGENGQRDGNARRRRRGRRGGRRNRERREQGDDATPDLLTSPQTDNDNGDVLPPAPPDFHAAPLPPPTEEAFSSVAAAVAEPEQPAEEPLAAEPPAEPAAAPEPAPAASTARRRSTVREPAPRASAASEPSAPTAAQTTTPTVVSIAPPEDAPAASSSEAPPASPKRGWWGKRLLGH